MTYTGIVPMKKVGSGGAADLNICLIVSRLIISDGLLRIVRVFIRKMQELGKPVTGAVTQRNLRQVILQKLCKNTTIILQTYYRIFATGS